MKLVKEHIISEKFIEDSDPVKDMDIGNVVNLYKKAKELAPIPDDPWAWVAYYHSLAGKYISGKFRHATYESGGYVNYLSKKAVYKKLKIVSIDSFYSVNGRFIFLNAHDGKTYYILPKEYYHIS